MIIALAGRRGSGKDTAAAALTGYLEIKFASALKSAASVLFGLDPSFFCRNDLKDSPCNALNGSTPRAVLQWLGTDVMQHHLAASGLIPGIGRGFWASRIIDRIIQMPEGTPIVISDMRFPHELQMLRDRFGSRVVSVRIMRPNTVEDPHESEQVVDKLPVDYVIANTGSIEDLQKGINTLVRVLEREKGLSES